MLDLRLLFLALGLLSGLALAVQHMASESWRLPDTAAARVNHQLISQSAYQQALDALARDLRRPLTADDRRHVLDQLIHEELLFQHALDQGLASSDPQVRNWLVAQMLESERLRAELLSADDATLRRYYQQHQQRFAPQWRYRLSLLRCASEAEARAAYTALQQGADWNALHQRLHQPAALQLPQDYLPAGKWQDYLGAQLSQALRTLQPGETTPAMALGDQWVLLHLLDRQSTDVGDWDQLRPLVAAEWRREQADESLRQTLEQLRRDARIQRTDESAGE